MRLVLKHTVHFNPDTFCQDCVKIVLYQHQNIPIDLLLLTLFFYTTVYATIPEQIFTVCEASSTLRAAILSFRVIPRPHGLWHARYLIILRIELFNLICDENQSIITPKLILKATPKTHKN